MRTDCRRWIRSLVTGLCVVASGWLAAACHRGIPDAPKISHGSYREKLDIRAGGFRRAFHVHMPAGFDGKTPLPLVVVIHGAFDTAAGMEKASGFSRLAERGDMLAAAAPLGASAGGMVSDNAPAWQIPEPAAVLPLLSIHGLVDDFVPFSGGRDELVSPYRG